MEIWRAHVPQFFLFCYFFYCFGCHTVPSIIWFFKLLILLPPPCSSISGQFDIQKHWASRAYKATFKSLVLDLMSTTWPQVFERFCYAWERPVSKNFLISIPVLKNKNSYVQVNLSTNFQICTVHLCCNWIGLSLFI